MGQVHSVSFSFSNDKWKSAGKERRAVQLLSALWDEASLLSTENERRRFSLTSLK